MTGNYHELGTVSIKVSIDAHAEHTHEIVDHVVNFSRTECLLHHSKVLDRNHGKSTGTDFLSHSPGKILFRLESRLVVNFNSVRLDGKVHEDHGNCTGTTRHEPILIYDLE